MLKARQCRFRNSGYGTMHLFEEGTQRRHTFSSRQLHDRYTCSDTAQPLAQPWIFPGQEGACCKGFSFSCPDDGCVTI